MATSALGYQSFYQAQLTSNIDDTELIIPLDTAPIPDEGFLVIESTVASKREIIYYTSKTSNSVTCPAGAGLGRGYDGTTAVSHLSGAAVIMAPVAAMFESLTDLFTTTPQGWTNQSPAVSTVVANGNRSYTLTHASSIASVVSAGMRRRFTRTSAAPITSFSLNGTNMYFNKTSPAGMTFTDDFVVSAWVKLSSYNGTIQMIASRWNGTSGWYFCVQSTGTITLAGTNAGGANISQVNSYQSVPLNKWVHVTAQLDMSTFTATTTTSYVMIDGVNVPANVTRGGTNPTTLIQAGNLEIGSDNGGALPFGGKIAQVAIYSAKVTQATILASIDRGLTGSETSLISAYSGANTTDLASTGNNLTAQNGAVSGYADAPFGNGGISSTLEYGLTMSVSSDGLTEVVQCPEGCALPTTGGITASAYSSMANPYGWAPVSQILSQIIIAGATTTTSGTPTAINGATSTFYIPNGYKARVTLSGDSIENNTINAYIQLNLWDGAVGSGTVLSRTIARQTIASMPTSFYNTATINASSVTKTINASFNVLGGGTGTINTAPTYPFVMTVELVAGL